MKPQILRWLPYAVLVLGAGVAGVVGGMVYSLMGVRLLLMVGMEWVLLATALWATHVILWPSFEGTLPWRFFLRPAAWLAGLLGIRMALLPLLPPPYSPFVWIPGFRWLAPATDILWMLGFVGVFWELREAVDRTHATAVPLALWGLAGLVMLPLL